MSATKHGLKTALNCPICGNWATVIDTQTTGNSPLVKRRAYLCANMHRFKTMVTEEIINDHKANNAEQHKDGGS